MDIRIKGYQFRLRAPFEAGSVLTKGEAQALNNLRAENIQDNIRKAVSDACAVLAPGELLPPAELSRLQDLISKYDQGYQFLEKHTPKPRKGELELELRAVAEERARVQFRQAGMEPAEAELEAAIAEMEQLPAVQDEARARVSARRRVAASALEDLI